MLSVHFKVLSDSTPSRSVNPSVRVQLWRIHWCQPDQGVFNLFQAMEPQRDGEMKRGDLLLYTYWSGEGSFEGTSVQPTVSKQCLRLKTRELHYCACGRALRRSPARP